MPSRRSGSTQTPPAYSGWGRTDADARDHRRHRPRLLRDAPLARPLPPLDAALRAAPLDDAYRIQDALHKLMAEAGRGEVAGWKIALTSKAMQQMTGVDQPAAGAIFSTAVHPSPARVDLAAYHHLGVEFEVAVRVSDDLPASGGPWTRGSVARRVSACLPAFELVED